MAANQVVGLKVGIAQICRAVPGFSIQQVGVIRHRGAPHPTATNQTRPLPPTPPAPPAVMRHRRHRHRLTYLTLPATRCRCWPRHHHLRHRPPTEAEHRPGCSRILPPSPILRDRPHKSWCTDHRHRPARRLWPHWPGPDRHHLPHRRKHQAAHSYRRPAQSYRRRRLLLRSSVWLPNRARRPDRSCRFPDRRRSPRAKSATSSAAG